jgi:hypothetical protein
MYIEIEAEIDETTVRTWDSVNEPRTWTQLGLGVGVAIGDREGIAGIVADRMKTDDAACASDGHNAEEAAIHDG